MYNVAKRSPISATAEHLLGMRRERMGICIQTGMVIEIDLETPKIENGNGNYLMKVEGMGVPVTRPFTCTHRLVVLKSD